MKILWLVYHISRGVKYGFPLCCNLRWSFERTFGQRLLAVERGVKIKNHNSVSVYVPCGIFHHCDFTWTEWCKISTRWEHNLALTRARARI